MNWDDFAHATVQTDGAAISVNYGGSGPAVLLLHGFPETKLMWREIALRLAEHFFVVAADLRGYGDSSTPPSTNDHLPYSRAMANDIVQVMAHLGHDRFVVAGPTEAAASPTVRRSTTRRQLADLPCSTYYRSTSSGTRPRSEWLSPSGPGRCSPKPNHFPSGSSPARPTL